MLVGSINTACAALFLFCGTEVEPELDDDLGLFALPLPKLGLGPEPKPGVILGAKRELEPDTKLEPEETDAAPETTPAKNGACVGSINTACAALLDFWDGGGRGASEGVGVWFIILGVGVLLFEDKERNVLWDGEDERNGGLGWEGLEGEDVVTVFGLEGRWRER